MHPTPAAFLGQPQGSRRHLILLIVSHTPASPWGQPTLDSDKKLHMKTERTCAWPSTCACSHTAASALLNSTSLGLAEQVTAIIVTYIRTQTCQETQPGMEIFTVATSYHGPHTTFIMDRSACAWPCILQRSDACSEITNLKPHQPVRGEGKGNILYFTVNMSSQKVVCWCCMADVYLPVFFSTVWHYLIPPANAGTPSTNSSLDHV